jgi:endo-1,4-beta-xylanase
MTRLQVSLGSMRLLSAVLGFVGCTTTIDGDRTGGPSEAGAPGAGRAGSNTAGQSNVGPGGGGSQAGAVSVQGGRSGPNGGGGGSGGRGAATAGSSGSSPGGGHSTGGAQTSGGAPGSGGRAGSATGGRAVAGGAGPGAGASGAGTSRVEFVGNITTRDSVDTDGKTFATYWDQVTPENAGKWGSVQSSAGASFNWRTLDAIYDYAETNRIIFKQHAFIWGTQQPSGSITEANVKTWMSEFCKRYPNTKLIDVVNEPPPHTTPAYADSIGGGTNGSWQWIANAFKWAREACPQAILILNDYNNIEWPNDNRHLIEIVKAVRAAGAPIDAIGAQAHDLDHPQVSSDNVRSLLNDLATETGLPIYITEMDISDSNDAKQLELYQRYIPLFMDSEHVRGITLWGWIYGKTWSQAPDSGLIRNGEDRPAMTWLMQQIGRAGP